MSRHVLRRVAAVIALAGLVLLVPARSAAQATGGLSGRVTRATTGEGLAGVTIDVETSSGYQVRSVTSGLDGRFDMPDLQPGLYFARTAAEVTVTFLRESEGPFTTQVHVDATSRATVFAGWFPELAARSFSIVVEATEPIVCESWSARCTGRARPRPGARHTTASA